MKALLFVLTVVAMALVVAIGTSSAAEEPGAGFVEPPDMSWYYSSPCQQPEGATLHEWLGSLPEYGELALGGWDCSQISAYIEWLAENCEHEATIACRRGTADLGGHCWVVVEGGPYEAVWRHWIDAGVMEVAPDGYYTADVWLDSIHAAYEYTKTDAEWAWWLTHPGLREVQ